MIIEGIMNLILTLLQTVFAPLELPDLPASIQSVIDEFIAILTGAVGLFSVFFRMSTVKILVPLVIAIANFDKLYSLIMYILRKIPFLGIE